MTNKVGFSTYAFSKPRVSLATNRAHWLAGIPILFEDSQPLARKAIKKTQAIMCTQYISNNVVTKEFSGRREQERWLECLCRTIKDQEKTDDE